ncbi:hypothetical protein B0H11DRAFT_2088600, partial [Mycena galericulata]
MSITDHTGTSGLPRQLMYPCSLPGLLDWSIDLVPHPSDVLPRRPLRHRAHNGLSDLEAPYHFAARHVQEADRATVGPADETAPVEAVVKVMCVGVRKRSAWGMREPAGGGRGRNRRQVRVAEGEAEAVVPPELSGSSSVAAGEEFWKNWRGM